MATTPGIPLIDSLYQRSREDLLAYSDARFNSLLSAMPNCYTALTDYSVWGSFLRAVAEELARMEYLYSYGLVSVNPQYLTPPDIKRQFAGPLFINSSFPNAAQTDQDYKAMLVALIPAYRMGTTLAAIEAVILAYTGQNIPVEELYRQIGNGTVFDYDRNTLRLTVPGVVVNPLSAIASAAQIQTISQDLLTAISLAKPAHIGLDYRVAFGSTEDIHTYVAAINDTFVPTFDGVEAPPLPEIFTEAPMLDATSPNTELTAYGKLAGLYLTQNITAAQYAGLMSAAFQAEYLVNADGTYTLNPACVNDVILEDANGNPTGAVSKAQGVLAPQHITTWEIKGDSLTIFEM